MRRARTTSRHTHLWLFPRILLFLLLSTTSVSSIESSEFDYTVQTDVSDYMDLALAIRDMRVAESNDDRKRIYQTANNDGLSLQSLSLEADQHFANSPIFAVYVNAFRELGMQHESDSKGLFDGKPATQYANTLVMDLFSLDIQGIEATAALVFNILMFYWGTLWQILQHCETPDPQRFREALDRAVAIYVGALQTRNDNQKGYMIYNLAEFAGERFNQDQTESLVNSESIALFLELQSNLSSNFCTDTAGRQAVRDKVILLIQNTYIVLIQMLLHHVQDVVDNNSPSDLVEVFALSVLPQIAKCDRDAYQTLVDLAISKDVTPESRKEIIAATQQALSCFGLTCLDIGSYQDSRIPACVDPGDDLTLPLPAIGTYLPHSDIRELSYLDRDVKDMEIFLQLGAFDAALDYYQNGYNSPDVTLHAVASSSLPWVNSPDYALFTEYYQDGTYGFGFADDLIENALRGEPPFVQASEVDRSAVIRSSLTTMVLYLGARGKLHNALSTCDQQHFGQAVIHWDGAAALMIGSTESKTAAGVSLFATARHHCAAFDTCEPQSSVVGATIKAALEAGAAAIKGEECEAARNVEDEKIRKLMLMPLIQGLVYYTVKAAQNPGQGVSGHLLAYTLTLLPYLEPVVDADMMESIQRNGNAFLRSDGDRSIEVNRTFEVVRAAIPKLGLNCDDFGQMDIGGVRVGLCSSDATVPAVAPVASTTQAPIVAPSPDTVPATTPVTKPSAPSDESLAWGRYPFTYEDVAVADSMFTLDIRDMWFADSPQNAEIIYKSPSKHATGGMSGLPSVKSLQDFSTKASEFMSQDATYNFFRVALFEDTTFDGNNTESKGWPFGDAVEKLALGEKNGNSAPLGSEAAVVMEIWMMIVHRLHNAERACIKGMIAPDLLDSAVGLWIGQEQKYRAYSSGWSVYSLAQEALKLYNHTEPKESPINTQIMENFVELNELASGCPSSPDAIVEFRQRTTDMVRLLSIPLLQHLLFHMSDNNFAYVELFALAFVPLSISVDERAYEYLRDALFEGFNWEDSITEDLLAVLGKTLHAMRLTCDDLGDTSNASDNLNGLVAVVCDEMKLTYESDYIAGYQSSTDVTELARIDLDVQQIDIFMRANAYDLAWDVYQNGRNSRTTTGLLSLKELAVIDSSIGDPVAQKFKDFYKVESYADRILTDAIKSPNDGRFAGASRRQRSEAAHRTFQTMVSYVQVMHRLRTAVATCRTSKTIPVGGSSDLSMGQRFVDEAVAIYVGSIEGPYSKGSQLQSGKMMYELAKDMCQFFDKCETHGDSEANVNLQFSFSNMKEALDRSDCDAASSLLDDSILNVLPISIIQGTLYYADLNDGLQTGSANPGVVAGDILAETLLPEFDGVNETATAIIFDNMDFSLDSEPVRGGKAEVFNAVSSVLRGFGVDCNAIGTLKSSGLSACGSATAEAQAPPPNTPTNLGNDLYVATTYVQDRANIALDILAMEDALSVHQVGRAELIYLEGENSKIYDSWGKILSIRSLSSFSTDARVSMRHNPLYHIAVYALQDGNGKYMSHDASRFADTVVKELFLVESASGTPLAAEAAVSLNLWMEITNELYETVQNCKNKVLTDEDGVHSIDEAAAYWIGDGQVAGEGGQGHLLYALAETMGEHFNVMEGGQSRTNANILRLFHQAKMEVSLTNGCTESATTAKRVSNLVEKTVSQMIVVNVQALIHYLREDDMRERVWIYAHAVVPLLAGCNPNAFSYLKEKLLDRTYGELDVDRIVLTIRSALPCFSLRCEDVGIHTSESSAACIDPTPLLAMADYKPATEISEYSRLDLDILQMSILMEMGAFDAAEEIYNFGKHAAQGINNDGTAMSLSYLATNSGRSVVPQFDSFRRYFSNDDSYADTIFQGAFASETSITPIQRKVVAVQTSQYMIMHMAALESLQDAVGACSPTKFGRESPAAKHWDKAAAFLIGSLEGFEEGGSEDGMLLWGLSKRYCEEFGTCSPISPGSTKSNDYLATLLYSGRGSILSGSCDELRKVANELVPQLYIPLMQGLISAAGALVGRSHRNKEEIQAEAHIMALSVLPLFEDVDRNAADVIELNFPLDGAAMTDGIRSVGDAISSVLPKLHIKCEDVGTMGPINPCTGYVTSRTKDNLMLAMIIVLGAVTSVSLFVLIRSKRKGLPENNPTFIEPTGELNHTSELLCTNRGVDSSGAKEPDSFEKQVLNDASAALMDDDAADEDDDYVKAIESALNGESKEIV